MHSFTIIFQIPPLKLFYKSTFVDVLDHKVHMTAFFLSKSPKSIDINCGQEALMMNSGI